MGEPEREPTPSSQRRRSLLSLAPRLVVLLYHLARDRRVPWTAKAAAVGAIAYIASPIDLIPDWIPGAGYIDDALVFAAAVNFIFAVIPEEVLIEHWGEDVETLRPMGQARRPSRTA